MRRQQIILALIAGAILLLIWASQPSSGQAAGPPDRSNPPDSSDQGLEVEKPGGWSLALQANTLQAEAAQAKVEPALLKRVLEGDASSPYRFIVELATQADLPSSSDNSIHTEPQGQVVLLLQATAEQAQAELLTFLQGRQITGQVQQIHPFWIFNGVAVTGDADTLLTLAARSDVRIIREDHWRRWVDPPSTLTNEVEAGDSSVEWNISRVQADRVWEALNLDGSGVTVAILDTGVDWQHPALQMQYRGYKPGGLAFHQGNWICTTDEGHLYPVDGYGHGTHVAGIAVGSHDATGQAIGVAPGAQWIAAKILNDEGYGYDSWIHAGFEWVMAPAGDPTLAPNVVNGSWGSSNDTDEVFRADLQALRAMGIVPIFAAGNDGPFAATLDSPGSYPEAITVGATDDQDEITYFSSRGPSPWDEIKPEVVAPGARIWSSLPGGTYFKYNGTSMAAPHVTGLAALLLQADPTLTVDEIEELITSTAQPLGEEIPNNDTGWGRVNAYQASAVALKAGFVTGQVTRRPDHEPLPTARVTLSDHLGERRASVQVDDAGRYEVALLPGHYILKVDAFGYETSSASDITVQTALTTTADMLLTPLPTGVLWGRIGNADTDGPVGSEVWVVDTPARTTSDPQTGQYSLALPAGTYTVQVTQNGYRRHTASDVEIVIDKATRLDVALLPAPTLLLVDSGQWYYRSEADYFEQALDGGDYVYDLWQIRDSTTDVPGLEDLSSYEVTIWSSPHDSPGLIGAGSVISNYLGTGGNLLLTGQDIGFWDGGLNIAGPERYYLELLKAIAVADDASRGNVVGLPGTILDGLSLPMNGADSARNQIYPDAIALLEPRDADIIGRYEDDGDAALQASGCQLYRAVYLAAGLEGLGDRASRAAVMDRAVTWLDSPHPRVEADLHPAHQSEVWLEGRTIEYTVELRNTGRFTDQFSLELSPSAWTASMWDSTFSQPITQSMSLGACQTQTLGLRVKVPQDIAWNSSNVVTLTARSQTKPSFTTQATFSSKAPAPILVVDDSRWYDVLDHYQAALGANHWPYDVWVIDPTPYPDANSPSLQRLQRYPVVIWFTAYDWYATLTWRDEARLAAYLDGGGRLLFSSQDYLYTSGYTDFARNYLGVDGYTESMTATQVTAAADSLTYRGPEVMDLAYPYRNWSDALRPTPGAHVTLWAQHGQPVGLSLESMPWKSAFFSFPLETLGLQDMSQVLGRTVDWLSPLGDSSLSVDRSVVADGKRLAYTLLIRNSGPQLLNRVTLSNTIPMSTSYVADSLQGPAQYKPRNDRITWNGELAPDQTVAIRYRLQLDPDLPAGTTVENVAHLSTESGLSIDLTAVSRVDSPDLSASAKVASSETARPGQVLTYTLIVRNDGLSSSRAHLVDPTPPYTEYIADSAQASSGKLTASAEELSWTGRISPDQTVTVTFPVLVNPSVANLYALNRAHLDDGWGDVRILEASPWIKTYLFLPLVSKKN